MFVCNDVWVTSRSHSVVLRLFLYLLSFGNLPTFYFRCWWVFSWHICFCAVIFSIYYCINRYWSEVQMFEIEKINLFRSLTPHLLYSLACSSSMCLSPMGLFLPLLLPLDSLILPPVSFFAFCFLYFFRLIFSPLIFRILLPSHTAFCVAPLRRHIFIQTITWVLNYIIGIRFKLSLWICSSSYIKLHFQTEQKKCVRIQFPWHFFPQGFTWSIFKTKQQSEQH